MVVVIICRRRVYEGVGWCGRGRRIEEEGRERHQLVSKLVSSPSFLLSPNPISKKRRKADLVLASRRKCSVLVAVGWNSRSLL